MHNIFRKPNQILNIMHLAELFTALFFSVLFVQLALSCYYSDSEIWLLTLSQKTFEPGAQVSIYYKWFFHGIINIFSSPSETSLQIYDSARLGCALAALLSLFIISSFFCKLYQLKNQTALLFLLLLSSTVFFNQGFRIRADIFALLIHSLFLVFSLQTDFFKKSYLRLPVLILLNLALCLTTPKAFYFLFLQLLVGSLLFLNARKEDAALAQKGKLILFSLLAPFLTALALITLSYFLSPNNIFTFAFNSALDFYLKSFDTEINQISFWNKKDFFYLLRFLQTSRVQTLILFLGTIGNLWLLWKRKSSLLYFTFHIYCLALIVFILIHNQKFPFFLGPFLTPLIAQSYCLLQSQSRSFFMQGLIVRALVLFSLVVCFKQNQANVKFNNNFLQRQFIQHLENYKNQYPGVKIYDIIGLLPRNTEIYEFIGVGESTRKTQILHEIQRQKPDVYIAVYKNIFLEPEISDFLQRNYFSPSPGIWVRSQIEHFPASLLLLKIANIKNKNYWVIKKNDSKLIFDLKNKTQIKDFLNLDSEFSLTQNETKYWAIPITYTEIGFVQREPLMFPASPTELFRFDTSF